jgi:histidyl-tRNA synthetase
VIIGEQELQAGMAVLRDMTTSEQKNVPFDQLPKLLR